MDCSSRCLPPNAVEGRPRFVVWLFGCALVGVGYYLAARLGAWFPTVGTNVSLIWPSAGLALAIVYRYGRWYLPGVVWGACLLNANTQGLFGGLVIGLGSAVSAFLGARLLRSVEFRPQFLRLKDVGYFVLAATVPSVVSALVGSLWLAPDDWSRLPKNIITWWIGDAAGVILFAPIALMSTAGTWYRLRQVHGSFRLQLELVVLVAVSMVLFTNLFPLGLWCLLFAFVPFVLVGRAAVHYRAFGVAVQIVIFTFFVLWANSTGTGIMIAFYPEAKPYLLWGYLVAIAVIGLAAAALLTERQRALSMWRAREQEYRLLLEDNPALICGFQPDGELVFANNTFRSAFQMPPSPGTRLIDGETDHNLLTLLGLTTNHPTTRLLRVMQLTDPPFQFDTKSIDDTNTVRWHRWSARWVGPNSSVPAEYQAVGLDITAQKLAETERQNLQAQAVQTQQFEALGVMAGGIAHEFNNILTSIMGYVELATLVTPPDSEAIGFHQEITLGAERAAHLVRQLMLYSGRAPTEIVPTNLSDMIEQLREFLVVGLPQKVHANYELAAELPLVQLDENKFRRLLMNLVINAGEATTSEGANPIIRTGVVTFDPTTAGPNWRFAKQLIPGEYPFLQVQDFGTGIPAEVIPRLFEPFVSTKFPGRGLGLAAVLGIVKDHRAAIHVHTEPGLGTTFTILFPPDTFTSTTLTASDTHDTKNFAIVAP